MQQAPPGAAERKVAVRLSGVTKSFGGFAAVDDGSSGIYSMLKLGITLAINALSTVIVLMSFVLMLGRDELRAVWKAT